MGDISAPGSRCLAFCPVRRLTVLLGILGWLLSVPFVFGLTVEQARERVFAALDPSNAALQPARTAWQDGRVDEAQKLLLQRLTARDFAPGVINQGPPDAGFRAIADAVLEDRFFVQDLWGQQPRDADGNLEWEYRGPRDDPEWAWLLNRHRYFRALLAAFAETGDTRYVARIAADVTDWVQNNDYPNRTTFSAPWRALEVARRVLESWLHVWEALKDEPAFGDQARMLMLGSLLDHADALRQHASFWGGNHLVTEKTALVKLARAFPEFTRSAEWLAYAAETATNEILEQTYPDGAFKELTNHYQRVALINAQLLLESLAEETAWQDVNGFESRVEAMWNYFIGVAKPSGFGPLNNASDEEHNLFYAKDILDFFAHRTDWRLQVERPSFRPASSWFPYAGHMVFRSGNEAGSAWTFFDVGPFGTAHQHMDRFHVSYSAAGRDWLVDGGRYTYQPGKWLDYFKGSNSHNTLQINGYSIVERGDLTHKPLAIQPIEFDGMTILGDEAKFPVEATKGHLSATWRRTVVSTALGVVFVVDEIVTFAPAEVTARWHFAPTVTLMEAKSVVRLGWMSPRKNNPAADSTFLRGVDSPEVAGWYGPQYNVRLPAWERQQTFPIGAPTQFVWILAPPTFEKQIEEEAFEDKVLSPIFKLLNPDDNEAVTMIRPLELHRRFFKEQPVTHP